MCSPSAPVAPAPTSGAGTWAASLQGLSLQQRLAACAARLEELAARPLLSEPFMQPLLAACAALASTPPGPFK
ncbi:hypothetical protein [Hymenobacter aerophilus]|uniref:hypothetical protein n=1 Tax=Hymenobacter aerophilus TaxID=119644 RepID=UPI000367030A|nr:hypothetical protein [Hymenobacter aerophilus]